MNSICLSIFFSFITLFSFSKVDMPRVSAAIFVNGGLTDFSILFKSTDSELKTKVQVLFDEDCLDHPFSKAYDENATFQNYWQSNEKLWHSLDINKDGVNELIFQSELNSNESESIEIYSLKSKKYKLIFGDSGHLLAYKIHPNTKEIILFHHKYPCCSASSHNINMVRLVGGEIILRKKYFVARKEGMKGDFFPQKVRYTPKYYALNRNTVVRWSPEIIDKKASDAFSSNSIATYPTGVQYRVLAEEKGWKYVLLCGIPLKKEAGKGIISAENFTDTHVFAWLH